MPRGFVSPDAGGAELLFHIRSVPEHIEELHDVSAPGLLLAAEKFWSLRNGLRQPALD